MIDALLLQVEPLLAETGYLAGGFAVNLQISAWSMGAGTVLGGLLGCARTAGGGVLRACASLATALCRNVPSFVLLFYMAFMLPAEVRWAGEVLRVPVWIKAALALTFPVIGFASDQTLAYRRQHRARIEGAGETFAMAWVQYFLIIVMASATASVIGADEIVARANAVIARGEDASFLLLCYGYVSLWFLVTGLAVSGLLRLGLWRRTRPTPRREALHD
jgi:His/Glu/Gln/Arg/opine family amino acid ABC transporter permease subunit